MLIEQTHAMSPPDLRPKLLSYLGSIIGLLTVLATSVPVEAQESLCATVKIEILQELALERQAFDARMRIK